MLLDDFVLAREHRGPVDLDVLYLEAEFLRTQEIVVDIGVVQENFRGNAADVQASPAQKRVLFDDGSFQSPLARADRGNVSARPAPDDHEIIFGQTCSPLRFLFSPSWYLYGRLDAIALFPAHIEASEF